MTIHRSGCRYNHDIVVLAGTDKIQKLFSMDWRKIQFRTAISNVIQTGAPRVDLKLARAAHLPISIL
jgi:hypothetical protein